MVKDGGILAPGLFEGIGQDGHVLETPLLVQGPGQLHDGRRSPSRVDGDGAEGVAEEITEQVALRLPFSCRQLTGRGLCILPMLFMHGK
jgi:hypothetical protein